MTISRILGSAHGGIYQVEIDLLENVTSILTKPGTAIELPIKPESCSWEQDVTRQPGGLMYDIKIQGFISGINKTNYDGLLAWNDKKIIVWFTDLHGVELVAGTLDQPCRILLSASVPADHKNPSGMPFTIEVQQPMGAQVLEGDLGSA